MKRFLMCLSVAVATAGCGGDSSDELDAALERIEELEAAQQDDAETPSTQPTSTASPATSSTTTTPPTTPDTVPTTPEIAPWSMKIFMIEPGLAPSVRRMAMSARLSVYMPSGMFKFQIGTHT